MKIKVFTKDGTSFAEKEFANVRTFEANEGLMALRQTVLTFMSNLRQGSANSKDMGEVRGTGKKPYRQKGTGNARHGSKRSPIHRGGGVVHGPKPRDFTKKLNKAVKRLAMERALYDLAEEGQIALIEQLTVSEPKTKLFNELIEKIYPEGKTLIVDLDFEDNTILSARNLPNVFIVNAESVNAYDLTRYKNVLVSERGFERILERTHA